MPDEPRNPPAGEYIVDSVSPLTNDEEQGIAQALASLRAGQGRTTEQLRQRLDNFILRK